MDQPTTVVQRLGRVLHWAGTGIGILLGSAGFWLTMNGEHPLYAGVIVASICFGVPFIIGRAALYVLAGE
jgi:hypothetical protein